MAQGKKLFLFFFVPKRRSPSVEDCLRKRLCNKERQKFGGSLSFFVL